MGMLILFELVIWLVIILASVMLVMAVRKISVQYARRTASGGYEKNVMGSRQFLPLKLNASGVMPIIFAQAIMFVPSLIGQSSFLKDTSAGQWMSTNFADIFGFWYNLVFALLIIVFTYFYTAITVPTNKMADDLKRSGGFIPGINSCVPSHYSKANECTIWMGLIFWWNLTINYGWSCNRYYATSKLLLVE